MKKILSFLVIVLLLQNTNLAATVYDDNYQEDPNYIKGMEYMESGQYASAINEFKKAVRTNPTDDSALIGLSNAYNMRAKYYIDSLKDADKAISDIKSALFFNRYFRETSSSQSMQALVQMEKNLRMLEMAKKIAFTPDEIAQNAKKERTKGEFAAAAYDYFRLINDNKYKAEANAAIGDIYKIFNRPHKAVMYYQNSLAANSNDTDVHLKLARVYEEMDDLDSSLKEYGFALNTSEERADILDSLEKIWQKRVDTTPKDAEAHANLGVVFQKQKRYLEALEEYKKAEALNPSNINTKINIATLYQEQKKFDAALDIYNTILQTKPQDINLLTYKAQCLAELKKTQEAINIYKKILQLDPKNSNAKTELFALIKNNMSNDDVLAFLYQNVKNSPQDANVYYEFAYELHKAGKIDDAITYYKQSITMDRQNIDAYINLSQCYRQKHRYADAYDIIKKAAEIDANNQLVKTQADAIEKEYAVSIYNNATNAYESGNYETAIEMYLQVKPQTVQSTLGIAGAYQALGNNQKAIEYYKLAMSIEPNNADIPYYIAAIYVNSNDFENAEQYIKLALSKNPAHSKTKELESYIISKKTESLMETAVKVFEDEKYQEAVSLFDKVIQLSPNDANAYYYRALSFDALKNYQKAINDYKTVIRISPQMSIAYYLIAVDFDNLKSFVTAKDYYKKYIEMVVDDNEYKKYAETRIKELSQ